MSVNGRLAAVPERIYVVIFTGIFLVAAFGAYFIREDTDLLERQILSKRKDLGQVLILRDSYEAKKRESERYATKTADTKGISLALIEETAAKSFVYQCDGYLSSERSDNPRSPAAESVCQVISPNTHFGAHVSTKSRSRFERTLSACPKNTSRFVSP